MTTATPIGSFAELSLPPFLLQSLAEVGYETPSTIQSLTIPPLLAGQDLVGQAQTGTGKTAAFALPVLATLDPGQTKPQALVLAPTRELAIQVAEAFQKYAAHLKGFRVLPLYGGSDYRTQLRTLQRGVQVIVGTPGRVMDHMRRGSLDLSGLRTLVLDEADEMLRMGFIDDVEWILEQTPRERQIALFSATMPDAIRRIAGKHLRNPEEITIRQKTVTNASIRQRVWMMAGVHKLDALTRILETEDTDGVIIFVRTRLATQELADKLAARGFASAALNGDIAQAQREKTVEKLKSGGLDIVVATDVAARGLDVERVSHVINYDIPNDPEAYVHRIGRTGRAGRSGEAILFAASRERRLLRAIERATGQPIEPMALPTAEQVTDRRSARFKARITETLASRDLDAARRLVEEYQQEFGVPIIEVAAALVLLSQGEAQPGSSAKAAFTEAAERPPAREVRPGREEGGKPRRQAADGAREHPEAGLARYRVEVGRQHGVRPGNIVGAIANEAEVDAEYIGRIQIFDDHSLVDLPEGMPAEIFRHLQSVWVSGQKLQISRAGDGAPAATGRKDKDRKPGGHKPSGKKNGGKKPAGKKLVSKKPASKKPEGKSR
ncbi:DEAD/DEAH box helicase [Pseudohaliea rubra]|uniref:ATP-dependent RNA helicase DeaD n=1 Tax=Pseudohaliea rubra DSM 19751 TaxID=1265313 RepID=A0A095XY23_9GAMM|nr:DEAD/DEAH box helicase [Pseudohaliea rubra]KGE04636.1 Cold-shock DEAD-box protein A [Pseudohaliea rubra DSM 19751]